MLLFSHDFILEKFSKSGLLHKYTQKGYSERLLLLHEGTHGYPEHLSRVIVSYVQRAALADDYGFVCEALTISKTDSGILIGSRLKTIHPATVKRYGDVKQLEA